MAFAADGRTVFVANSGTGRGLRPWSTSCVMTVDTTTNTVTGLVASGNDPRWIGSDPGGGYVFVSNTGSASVSMLTLAH